MSNVLSASNAWNVYRPSKGDVVQMHLVVDKNSTALVNSKQSTGAASPMNEGLPTASYARLLSTANMHVVLAAQAGSLPGTQPPSAENLFATLDADGSGNIDSSEFGLAFPAQNGNPDRGNSLFTWLDTDADGSISMQELAAGRPSDSTSNNASMFASAVFDAFDADGNGVVDASEFDRSIAATGGNAQKSTIAFAVLDKSADGVLTSDEFEPAALGAVDNGYVPPSDHAFAQTVAENNEHFQFQGFQLQKIMHTAEEMVRPGMVAMATGMDSEAVAKGN